MQLFRDAQHSRLPTHSYRETLDDPTGLVHVKDILALLQDAPGGGYPPAAGADCRPAPPHPVRAPSMRALDLLLKMQTSHTHLALVIDEYGGTDGLVSIEDIIEEIVGDIADEHDDEPITLKREGDTFVADARDGAGRFRPRMPALPCRRPRTAKISTRWAAWWCRISSRVPQRGEIVKARRASFSKCWKPIRAASAACASARPRRISSLEFVGGAGGTVAAPFWLAPDCRRHHACGAFSATAFPPFYFFPPALLIGLAGLALLLDGADDQPRKFARRRVHRLELLLRPVSGGAALDRLSLPGQSGRLLWLAALLRRHLDAGAGLACSGRWRRW